MVGPPAEWSVTQARPAVAVTEHSQTRQDAYAGRYRNAAMRHTGRLWDRPEAPNSLEQFHQFEFLRLLR